MNEDNKYRVIKKLKETNGNKKRAAVELGCSLRHVNRMLAGYEKYGKEFFSHGNKGRKPAITIPDQVKESVILLYRNKYYDANIRHFTELLREKESIEISEGSVRNILRSENILSPKAWKRTRKQTALKLKEQKDKTESKKEKEKLQSTILDIADSHPSRPRCKYAGEMLQMDASSHVWFGNCKSSLHIAIDDATGIIVGAYFDQQETLNGYYHVFEQVLINYGIPYMFYTDRRTIFEYKKKNSPKMENDTFTQFAYACKQLGTELKTTSIPQAKGRVERLFGTLQSRLPIELRLAGITNIEQANVFLNHYIKKYNAQFALLLNHNTSVFDEQLDKEKIKYYLSVLTPRLIDAGHSIRFNNKRYRLLDDYGMYTDFYKGTRALVVKTLNGELYCSVDETLYALEEILEKEQVSKNFSTEKEYNNAKKVKKKSIPPMNHPWKKDNFMKHVYAMHGHELDWVI